MTDKLPPQLLALFAPRPPLRWVAPADYAAQDRKTATVGGIAAFLPALASYKDNDGFVATESWLERKDRIAREKKSALEKREKEGPVGYNPSDDPNIRGDAFKTLIVSRLSYEADEKDLEMEFGRIGSIERIRVIRDSHADEKPNKKKKAHRGYAFVVFEREKDMRAAMEQLDGISIKGRRVKLDVERGRTVKGWKPRRLGGGLGGRGYTRTMAMRPGAPGGFQNGGFQGAGGFRGGRGGFRDRGSFGDRGGFRGGFNDRGGRGGGGFAPRGGDRGFQQNGYGGGAPANAPGGPGSSRGGYGDRGGDRRESSNGGANGGGYGDRGGGGGYGDRSSGGYRGGSGGGGGYDRSGSGSNNEPIGSRGPSGGGYRDRDYRPREDDSRKRPHDGSNYEEQRKLRRY